MRSPDGLGLLQRIGSWSYVEDPFVSRTPFNVSTAAKLTQVIRNSMHIVALPVQLVDLPEKLAVEAEVDLAVQALTAK